MAKKSFSAQVDAWARQSQERMKDAFQMASTEVIEKMQEPGPSVASTKDAIRKGGLGSVGRGKKKQHVQGPVRSGGAGNMPVDTGFLRNSLQVALNADLPPADRRNKGGSAGAPPAIEAVIAGADIGDKITVGYTAVYALAVNYGTHGLQGYLFVEKAMQQWPTIVSSVVARLKGA